MVRESSGLRSMGSPSTLEGGCCRIWQGSEGLSREQSPRKAWGRFSSSFLSLCSVILESDPQQVIQKVNFRVRVILYPPSLPSPPGYPAHPLYFPSSLCLGKGNLDGGNPSSSSRSSHWADAPLEGSSSLEGCQPVKEISVLFPWPITNTSPSSLVGSTD